MPSEYLLFIPAPLKSNKEKKFYQVPFKVIKKNKDKDDDDDDFDDMDKPREKTTIKAFDDDDKKEASYIEIVPSKQRPYSSEYRYMPQQVIIKNPDKFSFKGRRSKFGKSKIVKICKTYEEPDDFGEDMGSEMSSYSYLSIPANKKKHKYVSYSKYKPKAYSGQNHAKPGEKISMETLLRRLKFRSLIGKSSKQWLKKRNKRSYAFPSMTQYIQGFKLPQSSFDHDKESIRRSDSSLYTLQVIDNDESSKKLVKKLSTQLSNELTEELSNHLSKKLSEKLSVKVIGHNPKGSEFLENLTQLMQPKSLLDSSKYHLLYSKYLQPLFKLGGNRYNLAFSDIPSGLEDTWAEIPASDKQSTDISSLDMSTSDMSLSDLPSLKEPQKSFHSTHADFDFFKPAFDSYLEERSIEASFDSDTEGPSIVADYHFDDGDEDQAFEDGMEPSINFGMGMD